MQRKHYIENEELLRTEGGQNIAQTYWLLGSEASKNLGSGSSTLHKDLLFSKNLGIILNVAVIIL
ncbi:hypothetical protein COI97_17380 [Bacillus cereus]|nr:hypothetical protein COI97_17380 [Bacillus cereus]